jgi:hypothetical protein
MSRTICFDLIDKVFQEVGYIKKEMQARENMDKIINEIKTEGYNLPIYYYKDGLGNDCPYQLWEFNCHCHDYESDSDDY